MNRFPDSDSLLTRHPPPAETGSLLKYVIKITGENGFETPRNVLDRAGAPGFLNSGLDVAKLARVTGWHSRLKKIAYRQSRTPYGTARLMGHEVFNHNLCFRPDRICPECIRELGFVEAHFDLAVMVACPIHNRMLVGTCPECRKPLSIYRPGLLTCKCGADLADLRGEPAERRLLDLLDVVRRKTLRLPISREYPSGIPGDKLARISLQSILALINLLGRHTRPNRSKSERPDHIRYAKAAAVTLSDWPRNFRKLLRKLEPRASVGKPVYLSKSGISKLNDALSRIDAGFIIDYISDYAVEHHGPGSFNPNAHDHGKSRGKYVSLRKFAKLCGRDARSVHRLIEEHKIPTTHFRRGKINCTLVDVSNLKIRTKRPGRVFNVAKAAEMIGVSTSTMYKLRTEGVYEVANLSEGSLGFHEKDIEQFRKRLTALVGPMTKGSAECIRFDQIMKGSGVPLAARIVLIRKALAGQLLLHGSDDGTIRGLLFPQIAVNEETKRERARPFALSADAKKTLGSESVMRIEEAAHQVGCDKGTVLALAKSGLLRSVKVRRVHLFAPHEIERFSRKWRPLALLAHRTPTNAYGLMGLARHMGLKLVTVVSGSHGSKQGFIQTKDVDRLMAKASELLGLENRATRYRLQNAGKY